MKNAPFFKNTALVLTLIFSACASHPQVVPSPQKSVPENADLILTPGDGKVGTYTSSWHGFRTSSYWIEGPTGLIFIDTQFLSSAAEESINWAEKVTGKKVLLAIVLHPNPDKFNGTATFQKRGIKVVTADQVLKFIPGVHELRKSWFYERFKPDYPEAQPKPDSFGNKTTELQAGGITVKAIVTGAGCSGAHVLVQFGDHLFVGDLITQGFHSWLELGQLSNWLNRLQEIKALHPKFIHTGRGGTGEEDLIGREEQYLRTVVALVNQRHPHKGKDLDDDASDELVEQMKAKYPSYEYPNFVEIGLPEVWKRLGK